MIKQYIEDKTCIIKIDRPKYLNALNIELLEKLKEIYLKYQNSNNVRTFILTGHGEKAFIAGADIKSMYSMSKHEAHSFSKLGNDLTLQIENCSKPTICAINGFALGGGCELAMACHLRVASENAVFGQPESGLGLIPGFGGTQRLPRLVGLTNAYKILLSGSLIKSQQAFNIGLVSDIFEQKNLLNEAMKIASNINSKSSNATKYIIKSVNEGISLDISKALELETLYFKKIFEHEDRKIGISSFLQKKEPKFSGQ